MDRYSIQSNGTYYAKLNPEGMWVQYEVAKAAVDTAIQAADGCESWQSALIAERARRVQAEKALQELRAVIANAMAGKK